MLREEEKGMEIIDKTVKETYGPTENMQRINFPKAKEKENGKQQHLKKYQYYWKKSTPKEKHQATYFRDFLNPKEVKF